MNKKLYIQLLEAEVERLRDEVGNLKYELERADPIAMATKKLARQFYGPADVAGEQLKSALDDKFYGIEFWSAGSNADPKQDGDAV